MWGSGVFTALIGVLRRFPVLSSGEDGGSGRSSMSSSSSVWLLLMLPSCFSPSQVYLAASESSTRQSNLAFGCGCGLCRGFWQPGPHELFCCRHSSAPFSAEGGRIRLTILPASSGWSRGSARVRPEARRLICPFR